MENIQNNDIKITKILVKNLVNMVWQILCENFPKNICLLCTKIFAKIFVLPKVFLRKYV
jgi:hypothetical protein